MDLNLVVLAGKLAAVPEVRTFDSGNRLIRYLVSVRTEEPRNRVDVLPVTLWDPDDALVENLPDPGTRVWVAGGVQRRFWAASEGRRSRLEVVAHAMTIKEAEDNTHLAEA